MEGVIVARGIVRNLVVRLPLETLDVVEEVSS